MTQRAIKVTAHKTNVTLSQETISRLRSRITVNTVSCSALVSSELSKITREIYRLNTSSAYSDVKYFVDTESNALDSALALLKDAQVISAFSYCNVQ